MSMNGSMARIDHQYQIVDAMPADLRGCVHEFGFAIVNACLQAGVRKPALIRQLVHEIWSGARQPMQRTRGVQNSSAIGKLDWLLMQADCPLSASGLLRSLAQSHHVLVPRTPSGVMVEASMDAIKDMGRLTKHEKHKARLDAAISASAKSMWPGVFG